MASTLEKLHFDGLGGDEALVPNGYGYLSWKNFRVTQPSPSGTNGFSNDLHSGDSVAYNAFATPASIHAGHAFAVRHGLFAAGLEDNVTVTFTGYLGSKLVAKRVVTLDQSSQKIAFAAAFHHITTFTISSTNPDNPSFAHVAVEDLLIRAHIPHRTAGAASTSDADNHHHHHQQVAAADPLHGVDMHMDPAFDLVHDVSGFVV